MIKRFYIFLSSTICTMAALMMFVSCLKETELPVVINIGYTIVGEHHTTPLTIELENTTTGADLFEWTFENGTPATSNVRNPLPRTPSLKSISKSACETYPLSANRLPYSFLVRVLIVSGTLSSTLPGVRQKESISLLSLQAKCSLKP